MRGRWRFEGTKEQMVMGADRSLNPFHQTASREDLQLFRYLASSTGSREADLLPVISRFHACIASSPDDSDELWRVNGDPRGREYPGGASRRARVPGGG